MANPTTKTSTKTETKGEDTVEGSNTIADPTPSDAGTLPKTGEGANTDSKAKGKVRGPMVAPEASDEVDDIPGSTRKGHWDDVIRELAAKAQDREPREDGTRKSPAKVYEAISPTIASYLTGKYNKDGKLKALGFNGEVVTATRNTHKVQVDGDEVAKATLYVQVVLKG